jgi:hypothetical protein
MTIDSLIAGLTILRPYYDGTGQIGAEHDEIYVYPTTRPLGEPDLHRLIELGWHQPMTRYDGLGFAAKDYRPGECWFLTGY